MKKEVCSLAKGKVRRSIIDIRVIIGLDMGHKALVV